MSQALYRKWRPQSWEQVVGQDHVVHTLRNALAAERIAHAYLFAGPRGTGKTTTARLLAKAVNCLEPDPAKRPCGQCDHCQAVNSGRFLDLIEIDAASNTSVEDVRELRDKINFSPNQGRYKVYIIDEVHMLSTAAFNALLKTLEEPPAHAIFILATTEVHKIPATVLSRCQRHEFRRIPVVDIIANLRQLVQGEQIEVHEDVLPFIARQSTGAMRDAISVLDQLSSTGQVVTLEMAQNMLGTAASQAVIELVDALARAEAGEGLEILHRTLDAGSDARQYARQVVDYLRSLLLIRMGNADQVDATSEVRQRMAQHVQVFQVPDLLRLIRLFNSAANEVRQGWQPALPLEMALVEALNPQALAAPAAEQSSTNAQVRSAAPASARPAKPRINDAPVKQPIEEASSEAEPKVVEGAITTKQVNEAWKQVTELVKAQNRNTEALLMSAHLLGVRNNTVYLGLSEVLKQKMEKVENLELVISALQRVLGPGVTAQCVVATGKGSKLPPDVDGDGMVAAALRDLGGEIVDIQ